MQKAFILFIISLFMLASCEGGANTDAPNKIQHIPQISSLKIEPSIDVIATNNVLPIGIKVPFNVVAFDANHNKITDDSTYKIVWGNESNDSVAAINKDTGELETFAAGKVTVTATDLDSHIVATQIVTIESIYKIFNFIAIQAPIAITKLPVNTSEQLQAINSFIDPHDNTKRMINFDISNSRYLHWTSSDPTTIEVNNTDHPGLITVLKPGTATITAAWGVPEIGVAQPVGHISFTGYKAKLLKLSLEPTTWIRNNSVPAGVTIGYRALGYYDSGLTYDLTKVVNWQKDKNISMNNGLVTTLKPGKVTIAASYAGQNPQVKLDINQDHLATIRIKPVRNIYTKVIVKGLQVGFKATGVYRPSGASYDISNAVWDSDESAYISATGSADSIGVATGISTSNGKAVNVTATVGDVVGKYPLMVIPEQSSSFRGAMLYPLNKTLYKGITQQYLIIGDFDGYVVDLTDPSGWNLITGGYSITAGYGVGGVLDPGSSGVIAATSVVGGRTTDFTVEDHPMVGIAINGAPESMAKYVPLDLSAWAKFDNDTTTDITDNKYITWSSSNPKVIKYTGTKGKFVSQEHGTAILTATYTYGDGSRVESASVAVTVNEAIIKSLTIDPVTTTNIEINTKYQYRATLIDSNNNTYPADDFGVVTWSSSDPINLPIDNLSGLARAGGVATKNIIITATLNIGENTGISASSTANVVAATLQGLRILPNVYSISAGSFITYRAEAIYTNPTVVRPLTGIDEVRWSESNISPRSEAYIDPVTGRLEARQRGKVTVTAQLINNGSVISDPITATVNLNILDSDEDQFESLEIRANSSEDLAIGDKRQYSVIVHNAGYDYTLTDKNSLLWSSSQESVATINSDPSRDDFGMATARGGGSSTITAILLPYTDKPAHVELHVNAGLKIESMEIVGSHNAAVGDIRSYKAYGDYYVNGQLVDPHRDITKQVSWTINPTNVGGFGTGDKSNQLHITGSGSTTIIAAYNNESATFALSVLGNSHLESLVIITLGDDKVKQGQSRQYTLMAYYNNLPSYDATNDATWTTESLGTADIDNKGKLTAVSPGKTNIIATYSSESTTKQVEVVSNDPSNDFLVGVWLVDTVTKHEYTTSESINLAYRARSHKFIVMAKYKDGVVTPLEDNSVRWIPTDPAKVSFNNGIAQALESGVSAGISASYFYRTHTKTSPIITVNVPATTLSKLVINDAPASVVANSTYTFSATGYFGASDTTGTNPLLNGVRWISSDTSKLNFADPTNAQATIAPNASGLVTVSVVSFNDAEIESHITLNIVNNSGATLKSISLEPTYYIFNESGEMKAYQVTAHYVDSSLDKKVDSNEVIWSSDNESSISIGTTTGIATAITPGTTTISATYRTESATAQATFQIEHISGVFSIVPLGGIHIYQVGLMAEANLIITTPDKGKVYVGTAADWVDPKGIIGIARGGKSSDPVTLIAQGIGQTAVQVTYGGVTKSINVIVEGDQLESISLLPVESITIGIESLPFYYQVMGYFKDGYNQIHHQLINGGRTTITSDDPAIATVDTDYMNNALTGLAQGSTTITARFKGKIATANVTVDPNVKLESLMILPHFVTTFRNNLVCYVVLARVGNRVINVTPRATIDTGIGGEQINASCVEPTSGLAGVYVKITNQLISNTIPVKVAYADTTVVAGGLQVVALTGREINIEVSDQNTVGSSMHPKTYQRLSAYDDQNNDVSGLVKWTIPDNESHNLQVDANGMLYVPESAVDVVDGVSVTASYAGLTPATYQQSISTAGYSTDPNFPSIEMNLSYGNQSPAGDATPLHVGNNAYLQVIAHYADGGMQDITNSASVMSNNPAALAYNPLTNFVTALSPVTDDKSVALNAWYDGESSAVITGVESGMFIHSGNLIAGEISSSNSAALASGVSSKFTLKGNYFREDGSTQDESVDLTYDGFWQAETCANDAQCGIDIIPIGPNAGHAVAYGDVSKLLAVVTAGYNPANLIESRTLQVQLN